MESPDERLARSIADRAEAGARRRRLAAAEDLVRSCETVLDERRAALAEEESDVERLEHLSWTRIVASLRGHHASDLERGRAERDAARLAVREAEARLEQANEEARAARLALAELGDTEAAYRAALSSKEEWSKRHAAPLADNLARIAERRGLLEAEAREIREADDAGVRAHRLLAQASDHLGSAESWSTWDTFLGGGLITDAIKHGHMDDARAQLEQVDRALHVFAHELADLNQEARAALQLSVGLEVFDIAFDNIFSDWAVLRRIQDAQRGVREAESDIRRLVDGLRKRRAEIDRELDGLAAERERLLTPTA
jgi:hypothetical protein